MEYLIRFVQVHQTFRRAEIESLAILADVNIEILNYDEYVRFTLHSILKPEPLVKGPFFIAASERG